jgi:hypothetical protein
MEMKRISNRLFGAALMVIAASAPLAAEAQQVSDQWQFRGSIYGWLPDIGGKTTFPGGNGSSISVDASQIISSLKFTFMGTFEAQKGRWGVFTDVIYLDVGGSKSATRDLIVDGHPVPVGIAADATLDLKSLIWTLAGSYRVVTDPGATMDVIAGARLIDMKQTLGWQFSGDLGAGIVPARDGTSEAKVTKTDGIIGAKGRVLFGGDHEWFVPYYVDVGTGQTELTWQAVTGVGYAFNWGEVFAVWRYLDYNFKSSSKIEDVHFSGPAIGVAFRW